MGVKRGFIIDLTGEELPCCLLDGGAVLKPNLATLAVPLYVDVRKGAGAPQIFSGDGAESRPPDGDTLVFHNLLEDLPAMEDDKVQGELFAHFWSAVGLAASHRYQPALDADTTGYVVYPQGYSAGLLEVMRFACARSERLKRVVFVHEALALVLGLFYSSARKELPHGAGGALPVTVCVVLARHERQVEVACFDYTHSVSPTRRIVIRDHFRTTCRGLRERLDGCEWSDEIALLCHTESPTLSEPSRVALAQGLRAPTRRAVLTASPPHTLAWLKCLGAAHVARCSIASAHELPQYELVNSVHVGIRIDRQRFYPVLRKEELARAANLPRPSAKAFGLSGESGEGIELSLHAGYSDLVAESVTLGSLGINAHDLALLLNGQGTELFAAVYLNSPGGGELMLGLMPDDRVIGTLSFILPGLVC